MESEDNTIFKTEESAVSFEKYMEYDIGTNVEASFTNDEQTESTEQFSSWSEICRVCATSNDHIIPIFEGEGAEHLLSEKIHKYLPIRVSQTDTLPIQLCYHCAATILAWHELLEGCLNAEKQLLKMQDEQNYKENYNLEPKNIKIYPPVDKELAVDPNSMMVEKPESSLMDHQEEGANADCNLAKETTFKRFPSTKQTFRVFLDTQIMYQRLRRVRNDISELEARENAMWRDISFAKNPSECFNSPDFADEDINCCPLEESKIRKIQGMNNFRQESFILSNENPASQSSNFNLEMENFQESSKDRVSAKKCNVCSREFFHMKELRAHVRKHKTIVATTRKPYKCDDCSKTFRLKDSFIRHLRIHRDERPFTCHVCGKQFRDSGGLSRHVKDVHAKRKNFRCDICPNSFSSKATRDDHRRTHTGERPYACDNCDKSFKSRACLYIHSKIHTDEFPYPCAHCEKKFRRRQEMLIHLSTHTGEKNYSCDVCSRRFRVKTEVTRHKLTHSDDKPYICAKCGLGFRQNRYLNNHVKSRHSQPSND